MQSLFSIDAMPHTPYDILTIVGPTASGKTALAAHVSVALDGEIISADSRQVYRGMTIGTGKDLADYVVDGQHVPYHLIDIVDAGYKYNLYEYRRDFADAYDTVCQHGRVPVLCGGTGLYVEAVLGNYKLVAVPENPDLRQRLAGKTLDELTALLQTYKTLHNTTDVDTVKRAVRAIEIADYYRENPQIESDLPRLRSLIIGVAVERDVRRAKISQRLRTRLDEGMVDEVQQLLDAGVSPDDLLYYGLEYKFVTNYLLGRLTFDDMVRQLEIAIHQFAKRQMTWFRGMERRGFAIHWIDAQQPMADKVAQVCNLWRGE
ncbi:MAG: tRNA (adenosine(37)-N6)-dimethylallyltransferase MiaA [Paludibacteraceae bacterium]